MTAYKEARPDYVEDSIANPEFKVDDRVRVITHSLEGCDLVGIITHVDLSGISVWSEFPRYTITLDPPHHLHDGEPLTTCSRYACEIDLV